MISNEIRNYKLSNENNRFASIFDLQLLTLKKGNFEIQKSS